MSFVHLHCHSHYSLLEGAASPEELIARARDLKMTALALTDHNGLYGAVSFYKQARQEGLRPIIGAEVDLDNGDRIVMLAETNQGYHNLCQLISALHLGAPSGQWAEPNAGPGAAKKRLQLPVTLLREHSAGLTALSGGQRSLVARLVRGGKTNQASRLIGEYIALFGADHFFVELQAHGEDDHALVFDLVRLARALDVPCVAANDVLYLEPTQERSARVLAAIRTATTLDAPHQDKEPTAERWLKSTAQMERLFEDYPEALANTHFLAQCCAVELPLGQMRFPPIRLDPHETPFSQLWKRCFSGVQARYQPLTVEVIARLKHELETIDSLGFAPYFLVVADIVAWAQAQGIPVIARGSAADSLVSYALGISQVDPLKHGLYFERFLNKYRGDPPDIDLDICWRRRDTLLDHVYQTYGRGAVAMVGTHIAFKLNSAWRDVGKVLGLAPDDIDRIGGALPQGHTVAELDDSAPPEWQAFLESHDANLEGQAIAQGRLLAEALGDCAALDGRPRHIGIHSGGLVIAPYHLADEVPLQRARKGLVITQYDMDAIADIGLIKMDLLGSRGLSALHDAVSAVRQAGVDLSLDTIPWDDAKTYEMLAGGASLGCFQLESPGVRQLLRVMQPRSFADITAAISLFRPGPLEGGFKNAYLKRRLGEEQIEYAHPDMERLLGETYGVVLYQEQFLLLAHELAGLDLGQAEQLRKKLSKNPPAPERDELQHAFVAGAIRNGLAQATAAQIWQVLDRYTGFGFCKGHAASYAVIAYRSAYMKAHYPAEFIAAVLSNQGGYYQAAAYVEEARRLGCVIHGPDVNRSEIDFSGRAGELVVGLNAVRGLSEKTIGALLAARRGGSFSSLRDLLTRVELSEQELTALVKVGALDRSGGDRTRRQLLWQAKSWLPALSNQRKRIGGGRNAHPGARQEGLPLAELALPQPEQLPDVPEYTPEQRVQIEQHYLGFSLNTRPLEFYETELAKYKPVPSRELPQHIGASVVIAGRPIAGRRHITRQGQWVLFLSLEDDHGIMELVLFPQAYREYAGELSKGGPFIVRGKIESPLAGELALIVEKVKSLGNPRPAEVVALMGA